MSRFRVFAIVLSFAGWCLSPALPQSPSGATARVNGIEMHYETHGAGEPLVLLHGFWGCTETWQAHVEAFAQQYRVIVIELRGHGLSTNPARTFTLRQSASDVIALLDQLGVQRFRAIGHSGGGMTLLHIATRQPERIDAMILTGATSYFPDEARALMAVPAEQLVPPTVRETQRKCAKQGDEQLRELDREFMAFKDSYDDMNFTAPLLSTIKARTLIVQGDRDQFFPVSIPVDMHRAIKGSALWIIPFGGHSTTGGAGAAEFQTVALDFLKTKRP